jgi:hypothetical protein
MKSSDFAKQLRDEVIQLTINGQKLIECKNLTHFLDEKIPELDEAETVENQVRVDFRLAHYQAQLESSSQMFESVLAYGKHALNAIMIINAGAAVALLSLIGSLTNAAMPTAGAKFAFPLLLFVLGVVFSALASGGSYCTQFFYAENSDQKAGRRFHIATVVFVVCAYLIFISGAFVTYFRLLK